MLGMPHSQQGQPRITLHGELSIAAVQISSAAGYVQQPAGNGAVKGLWRPSAEDTCSQCTQAIGRDGSCAGSRQQGEDAGCSPGAHGAGAAPGNTLPVSQAPTLLPQ